MNFQQTKDKLRIVFNMTLRKKDNEYRVNFAEGNEDSAYYTNDLADAFSTGVSMAATRRLG